MRGIEKLFLGDWHPIVRDPLDLLRLGCLLGAVEFALRGDARAAAPLALTAVAVLVAHIALARLDLVPDPAEEGKPRRWIAGIGLITVWIAVTIASLCESYEWMAADWFGPRFLAGQTNTMTEVADALLGSVIAGLVLAAWAAAELPTRRRARPSAGFPA